MSLNMAVKQGVQNITKIVAEKSPTILTALGVSGLITTAVLAVKATPNALLEIETEKKFRVHEMQKETEKPLNFDEQYAAGKLTKMEIVKLTWKHYIPAAIVGGATIACIIGSNSINLKRQAAIASVYAMTREAMEEYQAKVVEQFGKNKEEKVRSSINQDKLDKNPINEGKIIITGKGKSIFYDALSGRYFESDIEEIRKQQNEFNFRLINDAYRPLNEWYDNIGLEPIELGDNIGWRADVAKLNILFDAKLANDKAVIVLTYSPSPMNI